MHGAPCVRPQGWRLSDVRREMKEVEPLAKPTLAAYVLMKLKGRWAMPTQCEMVLLQGFALKLHDLGFGAPQGFSCRDSSHHLQQRQESVPACP